ncbi:hypothetical protein IGI04_029954 [Brassica rapa subsp. trilocularis]|uniref:Aminotransferase-like plant mobile domain-containing protein n=1 Tax=Brassica rapa subsp. trilocularis TaxID=1813537 RepID=A0ABQ7LPA9_BRACM|nr:hypothetical protein IGI04_029954 [Brassica rapa subsp. trilocularis]
MCLSFNFPRPTTTADDLENLHEVHGSIGYYRAYLSFSHSCGLIFPIPEPILEILAEHGLSLSQLFPNFLRHIIAFLVKAREEGLAFGVSEFRQFILVKRNNQTPGTFLVSPRPGRHVIEHIPYRDEKWREQFFVFRMDRASMGDFNFSRLSRRWAENIIPAGSSSMLDEICGMMRILRRCRSNWFTFDQTRIQTVFALPVGTGVAPLIEKSEDKTGHSQEVAGASSGQDQSTDRLNRQLVRRSSFQTSGSASRSQASGKSPLISIHDFDDDDVPEESQPPASLSPGMDEETVVSDLISLAGCMRSAGCRLPSLASSVEKEAYAKVAVASSKVMEAFNEYVVMTEDHVAASRNEKEIERIGSEIKRLSEELEATKREGKEDAEKIEALTEDWKRVHLVNKALKSRMVAKRARIVALEVERDRDVRRASRIARRDTAAKYREILERNVVANIDLLTELKDGGLTVDAELAHLKEMERECADLPASAAVPDWSISELDLL